MSGYAIIDLSGNVVNTVDYDTAPASPPPGFPAGYQAVAVPAGVAVSPGWTYSGGSFVAPPQPVPTLQEAQALQSEIVKQGCADSIQSGVTSSALGAQHTYPTTELDQQNMTGSVTDAQRTPAAWQAGTAYAVGNDAMASGVRLLCTVPGTSGATVPTGPGTDGTVTWAAWSTPFWVMDGSGNWTFAPHTAAQIAKAGADIKAWIVACQQKYASLLAQIQAATTVAQVQAITWTPPSGGA